jgi:hypothetical protein
MPKKPQYKLIDIGNASESKEARTNKILAQIPEGKTIVLTDADLNLRQNKILVKIIDNEDIPKHEYPKKHIPPEIKATLIKAGFKNVTKTDKKHK